MNLLFLLLPGPSWAGQCESTETEPDRLILSIVDDHPAEGTLVLEAIGAPPGKKVRFLVEDPRGHDPCIEKFGVCLDLDNFRSLGGAWADESGVATATVEVPRRFLLDGLAIQAITQSCKHPGVSNVAYRDAADLPVCSFTPEDWAGLCSHGDPIGCFRDDWFDIALPDGIVIDHPKDRWEFHSSTDLALFFQERLAKKGKLTGWRSELVALELNLAFANAGAFGEKDGLPEFTIPFGLQQGRQLPDIAADIHDIFPEGGEARKEKENRHLARAMRWANEAFECSLEDLLPPPPPPQSPIGLDDCVSDVAGDAVVNSPEVLNRYFA
ncbi:MAG: hypothetical protein AAF602_29585, partial [Myxococcota bacterium]